MSKDLAKIKITSDFKHGNQSYYAGELRCVPAADAGYFCGVGWAESSDFPTGTSKAGDVTLDVHDVNISNSGESVNG